MIKKEIEGYFVRECGTALFSQNEFEDNGWVDERGCWNSNFHTCDNASEHQLHNLDNLLMLSKDVDDDQPYRMKITVELEAVDYKSGRQSAMSRRKEWLKEQLKRIEEEEE